MSRSGSVFRLKGWERKKKADDVVHDAVGIRELVESATSRTLSLGPLLLLLLASRCCRCLLKMSAPCLLSTSIKFAKTYHVD